MKIANFFMRCKMKIANFFILVSGFIFLLIFLSLGLVFILQQEVPQGVSVLNKEFIQTLVNVTLGAIIVSFGIEVWNNAVDSIKGGKKKCLEQEMVS